MESRTVSTYRKQIAELAKKTRSKQIFSLNHFLTVELAEEAWKLTRKDGAVGIDGKTASDYEVNLQENLRKLIEQIKSGAYKAPAVRRTFIPKSDGSQRPLGIPTLEDKIAQRCVAIVLECVYEEEFKKVSFGFRPKRSAHQALQFLRNQIMDHRATWVADVDIQKFFDAIPHCKLQEIIALRVRDRIVLRMIGKWLNAGVLENGTVTHPVTGTPQGGVISPLLANIYLHHVLDEWFETEVQPRLRGHSFLARFCDDFVMGFENPIDARRVYGVLSKRLQKFGLQMHPDKSRLVDFRSPPKQVKAGGLKEFEKRVRKLSSFNFLGFTHTWKLSRNSNWVVHQSTAKDRFARSIKRVKEWCRSYRHQPIRKQHKRLYQMVQGHFAYYGITGNVDKLRQFSHQVERIWFKWLQRRDSSRKWIWERHRSLLANHPLPRAKISHRYVHQAANL